MIAEKARVERIVYALGRNHGDRVRTKVRVEGVAHGILPPVPRQIDVADLAERVHAGVGAPGALYADRFAAEALRRIHQQPLHARSVVLDLPADKGPAVIFDGKLVAGHGAR